MDKRKRFDLTFKHEVCKRFMSGKYSKTELQREYGIGGKSTLLYWLHDLGYIKAEKPRINLITNALARKETHSEQDSAELKKLKERLLDAELRAEAYQRMITIAEQKYKIDIRKKNDTK